MSYFTIYFIGLTVIFVIYYAAMVVLDLKAQNEVKSEVETIEVPKPAPDAPPTDVEETANGGYVIKNKKNGTWKSRACLTPEGKAMLTPENFFILTPLKS